MTEKRFSLQSFYPSVAPLKKEYFISDIENEYDSIHSLSDCIYVLNDQQTTIKKQEEIIKSQDMELNRQYNLCLTMSGVLKEEFGVYDVFDRTKDRKIK